MHSYPSEAQLIEALKRHDSLVLQCINGELSLKEFCDAYDNFYWAYALDGHEADAEGNAMLASYEARILLHRSIAEDILSQASQPDSGKAVNQLRAIAAKAFPREGA